MESLQQDAPQPMDLQQHAQDLTGAIDAAMEHPGGPSALNNADPFTEAVMTAPAAHASMFVSFWSGMESGSKGGTLNSLKSSSVSMFVGSVMQKQATSKPTPLVPFTYGQKFAMARKAPKAAPKAGNVVGVSDRLALVRQSVTGGGTVDGKTSPIKGARISPQAAAELGLIPAALATELTFTLGKMQNNAYENDWQRLQDDLRRGVPAAKAAALNNPDSKRPSRGNGMTP